MRVTRSQGHGTQEEGLPASNERAHCMGELLAEPLPYCRTAWAVC